VQGRRLACGAVTGDFTRAFQPSAGTAVPAQAANSADCRPAFGFGFGFGFRGAVLLHRLAIVVRPRLAGTPAAGTRCLAVGGRGLGLDLGLRLGAGCDRRSGSLDRRARAFPGSRVARRRVTPGRVALTRITLS
jgi:hypothetical protein